MSSVDLLFLGPVIFAALYSVAAFACAARYGRSRPSRSNCSPPVTILKPLRGDDGQLYENLASFCRQDYRSFEIVFGVRDRHDPAIAVVNRLIRDFPDLELKLVIAKSFTAVRRVAPPGKTRASPALGAVSPAQF